MPQKSKDYETEWSFSFDKIADQIGNTVSQFVNGFKDDEPLQMTSLSEELRGATSANITLNFGAGISTLGALNESDNLLEADLTYFGEVEFEVSGDAQRTIKLGQKDVKLGRVIKNNKRDKVRWDVRLTPDIPLILNISTPVGESTMDLTHLNIAELTYKGGVGEHTLTLAHSTAPYHANINTGVGKTHIYIPSKTSVNVQLRGGVGETVVFIPKGTAVHLTASHGLGDMRIPDDLERLSGRGHVVGKTGVWQSPDYADAPQKVTIHYNGGVGEFRLEWV